MPSVADELAALRAAGTGVGGRASALQKSASVHGFCSPEQQRALLRERAESEKRSSDEARLAMHRSSGGQMSAAMTELYERLMSGRRSRGVEWRGTRAGGREGEGADSSEADGGANGSETEGPPASPAAGDDAADAEAVAMLPDRVVSALKERYETDDAAAALSRALREEGEGEDGGGALADLLKTVDGPSGGDGVGEEEETEDTAEEAEPEVGGRAAPQAPPVEPVGDLVGEPVEEPVEAVDDPVEDAIEKPVEEADEPVEEVRERLQELCIDEKRNENEEAEEVLPLTIDDGADPVEQTRRFYDSFSTAFVANVSGDGDGDGPLCPSSHRRALVSHIRLRLRLGADEPLSLLDVGCGHGRDARYFAAEGHGVLGVDYSGAMLEKARGDDVDGTRRLPNMHLLRMDARALGGALVGRSLDGVWAHSSLHHLPKSDLGGVLRGLRSAVKVGGVMFLSLKAREDSRAAGGEDGEVFHVDSRYVRTTTDGGEMANYADVRKLYSYYSEGEVRELLDRVGWEVIEMGVDDLRARSGYVSHPLLYVFATRSKD